MRVTGAAVLALFVCGAALLTVGCSSKKTDSARAIWAAHEQADRAEINGVPRDECVDPQVCTPDPGPSEMSPALCAMAEEGLEFLPIWDFNSSTSDEEPDPEQGCVRAPRTYNYAQTMYMYHDKSSYVIEPWDYEPPGAMSERCGAEEPAFHVRGGPFLAWGGGLGTRMDRLNARCGTEDEPDFCVEDPDFPASVDVNNQNCNRQAQWLDMTQWEGISFWGRRAPDGQPGVRIAIGDTNTDDDISFAQYYEDPDAPRACERIKRCGCRDQSPCTKFTRAELPTEDVFNSCKTVQSSQVVYPDVSILPSGPSDSCVVPGKVEPEEFYYCYDPDRHIAPSAIHSDSKYLAAFDDEGNQIVYDWCGPTACTSLYEAFQAADPQFHGKPCTEYTFRTGLTDAYCYDPETDPPPSPSSDECGDNWMKSVDLSTDWRFYKIPFTELLQQGWAKEFGELRIDQVSTVRFLWGRGYVDFWLDDVSFYRHADD
jgi:hypothetical protein